MSSRMKVMLGGVTVMATVLLVAATVISQDEPPAKEPQQGGDAMATMMAEWAKANAIGPEHDRLKKMVGKWNVESKMWMNPNAPPTVSQGTAECNLVFGGRFIEQHYKCPMMGMPFEGRSFEGYDRIKKKYVSVWMDSMSNGIWVTYGTPDAGGKSVTYYGMSDDPMTGEQDKLSRMVAREIDKDTAVIEMYDKPFGQDEYKAMELKYTRAE